LRRAAFRVQGSAHHKRPHGQAADYPRSHNPHVHTGGAGPKSIVGSRLLDDFLDTHVVLFAA
jgi:hypothetical protein